MRDGERRVGVVWSFPPEDGENEIVSHVSRHTCAKGSTEHGE